MKPRREYILLVALAMVALACNRPAKVHPVPGLADARRLHLRTDTFTVFLVRPSDTVRTGRIIDQLSVTAIEGRQVLVRVYATDDQLFGVSVDTIRDDFLTLQPLSHYRRSSLDRDSLEFGEGRATGVIVRDGRETAVDRELAGTVINYASWDLFLRASSLHDGDSIVVAAHLPTTGIAQLRARVRGSEALSASDGSQIATWVVDGDFAGMMVTFWIAQSSRELVRQRMRFPPGDVVFVRH